MAERMATQEKVAGEQPEKKTRQPVELVAECPLGHDVERIEIILWGPHTVTVPPDVNGPELQIAQQAELVLICEKCEETFGRGAWRMLLPSGAERGEERFHGGARFSCSAIYKEGKRIS